MEDLRRQEVRELARLTEPLTAAQQAFFQGEYGRHRRNPTTALLLCLLLGGFGAHYFYFGRHRAGLLRLGLCLTLVPAVLALFEARSIGARAVRYNASLASELLLAIRGTVHEQPSQVDALASLSVPTALPARSRAALDGPDEHDATVDSAEAALIAAAYAGRERAHAGYADPVRIGASSGRAPAAVAEVDQLNGGHVTDGWTTDVARSHLPASEYDTWYDDALQAQPAAAANGHGPLAHADGASGPDAPQWVPLPEWPARDALPAAVDDWAMPNLDQQNGADAPRRPQIAAADLLDGSSFSQPLAGDAAERPNSAIAAAAAGAAAAWAEREQPALAAASEAPAPGEREPVFMYQAAPAMRRPAVHYGPPTATDGAAWADSRAGVPSLPRRLGEDAGLASLGSLLAAGLADLLRDRPAPLRTRPLTQPPAFDAAFAASDIHQLGPIPMPLPGAADDLEDPWAVSASIRAPLAESPHLMPESEAPTFVAGAGAPAAHDDWLTMGADGAVAARGAALAAGSMWAHEDAPPASAATPPWTSARPVPPEREPAGSADAVAPAWPSDPAPVQASIPEGRVATPSQVLRRRIMHRLFVRKMAVLEGRVVAESSAERQVELIDDDEVMAERVRQATQSAAREALENLLQLAPPEALPAVRAQLRSLDLEAS
jgi:TM2 domain-containing membrane protein YozV